MIQERMMSEVLEAQKENISLETALVEEKAAVAKATALIDALEDDKRSIESKMEEMRQARLAEESEKVSALWVMHCLYYPAFSFFGGGIMII